MEPPPVLKEHFEGDTFEKSQKYGKDKAKFSLYSGLFKQVLDSALLHYGVYAWLWDIAGDIRLAIGYGPEHEVSYGSFTTTVANLSVDHRSFSHFSSLPFRSSSSPSQAFHFPSIKPSFSRKNTGLTRPLRGCSSWIPLKAGWSGSRSVGHSLPPA